MATGTRRGRPPGSRNRTAVKVPGGKVPGKQRGAIRGDRSDTGGSVRAKSSPASKAKATSEARTGPAPEFTEGVCLIVGKRGCGKSTEQFRIQRSVRRVIVWDPLGQYRKKPELRSQFTFECSTPSALKAYLRENFRKDFRILYVPLQGNLLAHWRAVGQLAYSTGNLMLCIDEIGMLCDGGKFAVDCKGQDPILESIVHYGRHRAVQVVATTQLPTDVALRYRSLCVDIRMFKVDEPAHVAYLAEKVGWETANRLPKLQEFDYVVWVDTGETYQARTERS